MNKSLLLASGLTFTALTAGAQQLKDGYIEWPNSQALDLYVKNWTPGQEITRTYYRDAEYEWEDENFFISRVKLKPLISNPATQIYPEYTDINDKKLLFWVPCGTENDINGCRSGSLPNGKFDSEVFSMWSYVTHWGNWASPYGWVPGGFADAAHKHGVLVSGLAAVPYSKITDYWRECFEGVSEFGTDENIKKIGNFLRYHGVDGLGYNSEWLGYAPQGLQTLHGKLMKYMKQYQPAFENIWYGGTTDSGNISFTDQLDSGQYDNFGYSSEPRTVMFLNYNWNYAYKYDITAAGIEATGRDPRDIYLGMNMSNGCMTSTEWMEHMGNARNYSIGLWGAHANNMLFPARSNYGGNDDLRQAGYQTHIEKFFTNGKRNPAYKMEIWQKKSLSPADDFHGISRLMSARSSLGWDLSEEPFITYFNLGNGKFFNEGGELKSGNEWYNLGMQDYMPTWRFWWANKILGNEPENVPAESMDARFTWDDAWFGGSCLRITGSADAPQYLHLFKTAFNLKNNDVITIRYKVLSGNGDINFFYTKVGDEATEQTPSRTSIFKTSDSDNHKKWSEVALNISDKDGLSSGDWALMGLKFANAKNLDMLIGEISIKRGNMNQPQMPKITRSKVLANTLHGFDAKLYWNMPNTKVTGEPVYNLDVNTSYFELWAQVEGREPQFVGTTTSWAGVLFRIGNPEHAAKVRLGVQAVSVDHKSKSGITWTEYLNAPEYTVSELIEIDKTCIKPNEPFRIWFKDKLHPNASLSIYNSKGECVASNYGIELNMPDGLAEIGSYNLVTNNNTYNCFFQISDWSVGALPEIETLTINGETAGNDIKFGIGEAFKAGYTGRIADGEVSRGLKTNGKNLGGPMKDSGLRPFQSFSISFWYRPTSLPQLDNFSSYNLLSIADEKYNRCSSSIGSNGNINSIWANNTNYYYHNAVIQSDLWTHVTFVFDYDSSNALLIKLYINGVYQEPEPYSSSERIPPIDLIEPDAWMQLTGKYVFDNNPGYSEGIIDDVTIWNTSIDETDIAKAMTGLDAGNLPDNVQCFWSFEDEPIDGIEGTATIDGKIVKFTHNGVYKSKGKVEGAMFGQFELQPLGSEGAATQVIIESEQEAGCPFVPGTAYKVTTVPTWKTRQATITGASGSDTEGEATIAYGTSDDKTLSLTLTNSWGSDSRDYPVIGVSAIDGIDADASGEMKAYTIDKTLFVEFAEEGDYEVNVYNVSGMLVGKNARHMFAGETMSITLANAGVYVVSVSKDGKVLRSVKVINK